MHKDQFLWTKQNMGQSLEGDFKRLLRKILELPNL